MTYELIIHGGTIVHGEVLMRGVAHTGALPGRLCCAAPGGDPRADPRAGRACGWKDRVGRAVYLWPAFEVTLEQTT